VIKLVHINRWLFLSKTIYIGIIVILWDTCCELLLYLVKRRLFLDLLLSLFGFLIFDIFLIISLFPLVLLFIFEKPIFIIKFWRGKWINYWLSYHWNGNFAILVAISLELGIRELDFYINWPAFNFLAFLRVLIFHGYWVFFIYYDLLFTSNQWYYLTIDLLALVLLSLRVIGLFALYPFKWVLQAHCTSFIIGMTLGIIGLTVIIEVCSIACTCCSHFQTVVIIFKCLMEHSNFILFFKQRVGLIVSRESKPFFLLLLHLENWNSIFELWLKNCMSIGLLDRLIVWGFINWRISLLKWFIHFFYNFPTDLRRHMSGGFAYCHRTAVSDSYLERGFSNWGP
jgi:hypothetical protein